MFCSLMSVFLYFSGFESFAPLERWCDFAKFWCGKKNWWLLYHVQIFDINFTRLSLRMHVEWRGMPRDSTSILKAESGKLDIKRRSTSILYFFPEEWWPICHYRLIINSNYLHLHNNLLSHVINRIQQSCFGSIEFIKLIAKKSLFFHLV